MLTVTFNPPQIERDYLEALNLCFGHWGDQTLFDWVFRRDQSFPATDLMVIRDETGELLAGSGISYRWLRLPNDHLITVGIMTGSWTLPAARQKGCFTRIITESISRCQQQEAALLIAFVTSDNTSMRRLAAAGAGLVSGYYLFTTPDRLRPDRRASLITLTPDTVAIERCQALLAAVNQNYVHFSYPSPRDFGSQMIERPQPTTLITDADGNMAVIEVVGDTDRIQALAYVSQERENIERFLAALLDRALNSGRKLFLYSTDPAVFEIAQVLKLGYKPGYITLLAANTDRLQEATGNTTSWSAADSTELAAPDSAWFLGSWQVQSGDRT